MNLKLKVTTRTPSSEEVSIFDTDTRDENGDAVNIGKMDLHYLEDQIVGTLVIWQEYAAGFGRTHAAGSDITLDDVIEQILTEVSEPLGLPSDYGVEIYFPSISSHQFISSYGDEGEEGDEAEYEDGAETEVVGSDEFAKQLKER